MKIAIISDIHGNMQALEAVLADIKRENCEKIFCLGDLAMAGPEPNIAINKIREIDKNGKLTIIQGNTDVLVANFDKFGELVKKAFPIMGNALENDYKIVSQENKDYLNNLPEQKEVEVDGVKVLLVHGSPRKNDENIFPNMPLNEIESMINSTKSDLIFCGHSHIPCGYQTNTKQTVVNVGSVGRPFTPEPRACYVVAEFSDKTFDIKHKFIDYDKEKASKILSKRDFEGAKKLSTILIKPENRHM